MNKKEKQETPNIPDIDESFIITSFKNNERLNNPGIPARPLEPKENKSKEIKESENDTDSLNFSDLFFKYDPDVNSRLGKMVNIRLEYHNRIKIIAKFLAKENLSIFHYIDNIIEHHLRSYEDELEKMYNQAGLPWKKLP